MAKASEAGTAPGTLDAQGEALMQQDDQVKSEAKGASPDEMRKRAESIDTEAAQKRNDAEQAQRDAAEAKKSDEQKKAEALTREADQKRLEADALRLEAGDAEVARTVGEAGTITRMPPETPLHLSQALKRANDPANPVPYAAEHLDDDKRTVRLVQDTPDGVRECWVHPEMVGDTLRSGWRRASA